jgi:hypothetical protein
MTDPPPPTPPQQPLEYWHATGQEPLHPVLLGLCTIAGAMFGALLVCLSGGCAIAAVEGTRPPHVLFWIIALIPWAVGIACIVGFAKKLRRDGMLSLEDRRRGMRFFGLGFLISCGVMCLLEGICFTAGAISQ